MIKSHKFYGEYHGHMDVHLKYVLKYLKHINKTNIVYLAGDSSLDNKYWLDIKVPACNGYQKILDPAISTPDVAHWMNELMVMNKMDKWCCINTAVEESTVAMRKKDLLDQDKFIQKNITENDVLIVSVGGNDVALKIGIKTIFHLGKLLLLTNDKDIKNSGSFLHLVNIFKNQTQPYISKLVKYNNPKLIIISSMYFPCLYGKGWADKTLKLFNYDKNYKKIHHIMKSIYEEATCKIKIKGSKVVTCKLFEVLDYKNKDDYIQRVEPSVTGGSKMAIEYIKIINKYIYELD